MVGRRAHILVAIGAVAGCSAVDHVPEVVTDTLPGGGVHVSYASLPVGAALEAAVDLTIGSAGGEGPDVFGDVRGFDAASDGTIYVLDTQAAEIRVFDGEGRYQRSLGGRGDGPGEITAANGLQLVGDTLWVQDHGKWSMLALAPDGTELERRPMPVMSYGYVWSGTIDGEGRFWRPIVEAAGSSAGPPEPGLHEFQDRHYLVRTDPSWTTLDSLFLHTAVRRTLVFALERGGRAFWGVPFGPTPLTAVSPGGGFWETDGLGYRFMRRDERGDTLVRVEADVALVPVSALDREWFLEAQGTDPGRLRQATAAADLMPEQKPAIESLTVDDAGRLWVGRAGPRDWQPRYDVFADDGRFLGAVHLAFEPARAIPIRIRHGHIYALTRDSLAVPYVVRAPVPEELGR